MTHRISTTILTGFLMGVLVLGGVEAQPRPQKAPPLPMVEKVAAQPLVAQVKRLVEALDFLGSPLPPRVKAQIESAASEKDETKAVQKV
jgi:hypothetical protein